jgi:hypothetical protein
VRAKARGVKFGRKPKLNLFQREQALARLSTGETQAPMAWIGRPSAGIAAPFRGRRGPEAAPVAAAFHSFRT